MAAASRQIQVLLTLLDGERSFGMSLAQKSSALGPKYTVVSSVFANSPADRAGVRKGYVVRCINDRPMNGLTVAQVANHFRNASQAKITLEVVENSPSPRTSAFTTAATFGGFKAAIPSAIGGGGSAQRPVTPVTGFSAASSGRAIAAPGTALAVSRVASPKQPVQPVLRLSAKPAAKTLAASHPEAGVAVAAGRVATKVVARADAKVANGESNTHLKSKAVAPVLRLGPKPKPVPEEAAQKVALVASKQVEPKPAAKSVPINAPEAKRNLESSRIPLSPVQAIRAPRTAASKSIRVTTNDSPALVTPAPAATATAPNSGPQAPLVTAKMASPVPLKTSAEMKSAAGKPLENTALRPTPSSSIAASTAASRNGAAAVEGGLGKAAANTQVSSSNSTTVNSISSPATIASVTPVPTMLKPVASASSVPTVTAPRPLPEPGRTTTPAPTVVPPSQPAVPTRSGPPPPIVAGPRPQPEPARSTTSTPARDQVRTTTIARSAPAPATPTAASTSTAARPKSGKKRGRPRRNPEATNGTTSNKGKGKAKARSKKAHKQQANDDADTILDDDEVLDMYALSSDSDSDESPSKKTARRAAKGRRRGATDRTRHSLTVDRLVGMGFTKEDAEASVREIGDDPDACMIWIISKIEERQFTRDLNEASIQSEQSKRDEEKRVKKIEMETLVHAEKFMSLFPSSYIACPESSASNLKRFLHSTIDQVDGETYIRKILTKLLTLEGKSIRWYKQAVRSYMLELSGRLDAALGTHDVMTCCARISSLNADPSDISCNFMRKILEEEKALTKALFEMPTNQGGVPQVFLECDETTKFDLDDDGFEVVEPNT